MNVTDLNLEFEKIYYKNYDYIYKFLLIKAGSKDVVEDIIQNVFLKFYQRLTEDGEVKILNPRHYLLKSAKGALADYYRVNSRIETQDIEETVIVDEKALEMLENDSLYTYDEIMAEVGKMDGITYKIFVMHFKYGYTIEKTAKKLNMPQSSVKSKMYRALKRLKDKYKEGAAYENI